MKLVVFCLLLAFSVIRHTAHCYLYLGPPSSSHPVDLAKLLLLNEKVLTDKGQLVNDMENVELENNQVKSKVSLSNPGDYQSSACQLVQIVHLLHHAGCQPKAIASFACSGSCPSYVQASTSKFWQHERSCSCCQQTGSQEATFTLDCPSLDPPYKKVKTYAPVDCMCRSCTDLGKEDLRPRELVEALDAAATNS